MAKKLQIISKKPKFRRAGFGFSDAAPTLLDPQELTPDQLKAITGEKNLIVNEIEVADPSPAAPAGGKAGKKGADPAKAEAAARAETEAAAKAEAETAAKAEAAAAAKKTGK